MFLKENEINEIERRIGYCFKNKELLSIAFRRKSFTQEQKNGNQMPNNEVLEFYGDAVLKICVSKACAKETAKSYEKGLNSEHNEEELTHFVSNYTDKEMLSNLIDNSHLISYLMMSAGDIKNEVYNSPSVKEDLFEAIIGAMWFDNNLSVDAIYDKVIEILDLRLDMPDFYKKNDFVLLKEFADRKNYKLIKEKGNYYLVDNNKIISSVPSGKYGYSLNGYSNIILAAKIIIDDLKRNGLWEDESKDKIKINVDNVTPSNAINKLQELYQKRIIKYEPNFSEGELNRNDNLWKVVCYFDGDMSKYVFVGFDKVKVEAKKKAAYDAYIAIANDINSRG